MKRLKWAWHVALFRETLKVFWKGTIIHSIVVTLIKSFLSWLASAPPASYSRTNHPELYAGAYGGRNAYEMRHHKVWQQCRDDCSSPLLYHGDRGPRRLSRPVVVSDVTRRRGSSAGFLARFPSADTGNRKMTKRLHQAPQISLVQLRPLVLIPRSPRQVAATLAMFWESVWTM